METTKQHEKHGATKGRRQTKLYMVWHQMISRCHSERHKDFKNYGARGISVHEPWRRSFAAFREYVTVTLGKRPPGRSLDRIDNDRGYEPRNLRWATQRQQVRNARPPRNAQLTNERYLTARQMFDNGHGTMHVARALDIQRTTASLIRHGWIPSYLGGATDAVG